MERHKTLHLLETNGRPQINTDITLNCSTVKYEKWCAWLKSEWLSISKPKPLAWSQIFFPPTNKVGALSLTRHSIDQINIVLKGHITSNEVKGVRESIFFYYLRQDTNETWTSCSPCVQSSFLIEETSEQGIVLFASASIRFLLTETWVRSVSGEIGLRILILIQAKSITQILRLEKHDGHTQRSWDSAWRPSQFLYNLGLNVPLRCTSRALHFPRLCITLSIDNYKHVHLFRVNASY